MPSPPRVGQALSLNTMWVLPRARSDTWRSPGSRHVTRPPTHPPNRRIPSRWQPSLGRAAPPPVLSPVLHSRETPKPFPGPLPAAAPENYQYAYRLFLPEQGPLREEPMGPVVPVGGVKTWYSSSRKLLESAL